MNRTFGILNAVKKAVFQIRVTGCLSNFARVALGVNLQVEFIRKTHQKL